MFGIAVLLPAAPVHTDQRSFSHIDFPHMRRCALRRGCRSALLVWLLRLPHPTTGTFRKTLSARFLLGWVSKQRCKMVKHTHTHTQIHAQTNTKIQAGSNLLMGGGLHLSALAFPPPPKSEGTSRPYEDL